MQVVSKTYTTTCSGCMIWCGGSSEFDFSSIFNGASDIIASSRGHLLLWSSIISASVEVWMSVLTSSLSWDGLKSRKTFLSKQTWRGTLPWSSMEEQAVGLSMRRCEMTDSCATLLMATWRGSLPLASRRCTKALMPFVICEMIENGASKWSARWRSDPLSSLKSLRAAARRVSGDNYLSDSRSHSRFSIMSTKRVNNCSICTSTSSSSSSRGSI